MPRLLLPFLLTQCLWIAPGVLAEDKCEGITADVFTTTAQPAHWQAEDANSREKVRVSYRFLDGIDRFNAELSADLSGDPQLARQQVMKRFSMVSSEQRHALQGTAEALALAIELNIRRYPAIVFNRRFVIYGVHDVEYAIRLYRVWCQATAK
ncbi:MAG: TIGR03757 family integrating conjugative element protein [Gammaproteobacteria bacterium]|nr:TIGR03757 family integrating conjugative element protein [Gammaproteobacteria bacterium]